MKDQHTPTPWKQNCLMVTANNDRDTIVHCGGTLHPVGPRAYEAEANAEFIARACNNYDDLLAACELALEQFESAVDPNFKGDIEAIERIKAAVAKARGDDMKLPAEQFQPVPEEQP